MVVERSIIVNDDNGWPSSVSLLESLTSFPNATPFGLH
jgi:hypothetical protein